MEPKHAIDLHPFAKGEFDFAEVKPTGSGVLSSEMICERINLISTAVQCGNIKKKKKKKDPT